MSGTRCDEFRKKQSDARIQAVNSALKILNEYYQYLHLTTPQSDAKKVEDTINKIKKMIIKSPESYKSDSKFIDAIRTLEKLLPHSNEISNKFWQLPPPLYVYFENGYYEDDSDCCSCSGFGGDYVKYGEDER